MKKVFVLYGSQTGNAESIAKELSENLGANEISNELLALNKAKGRKLQDECLLLLVVCSTTGNGDCPENADSWWRTVKLRSAAKDMFTGIDFAVLGLGDTNYDKFCHMGKSIDKRLAELGGNRALPLQCADEATNLEETVESWKKQVKALVKRALEAEVGKLDTACAEEKQSGIVEPEAPKCAAESQEKKDSEKEANKACSAATPSDPLLERMTVLPQGILNFEQVADLLGESISFIAPSPAKAGRTSGNVEKISALILKEVQSSVTSSSEAKSNAEWTFEKPFYSKIASGNWLSSSATAISSFNEPIESWGQEKRVVHCQLDLQSSCIRYQPGDSIGVCCPNPPYIVNIVLERLQQVHPEDGLTLDTMVEVADKEKTEKLSLGELLQFQYDLVGIPKKALLNGLSVLCTNEKEASYMQMLTGRDAISKLMWSQFIEQQGLGAGELLHLFPSCRPTLSQLLSCLSPMPPRYYSIASAQESSCNRVSIAFSLVRNVFGVKSADGKLLSRIAKSGVCTSYLEYHLRSTLYPSLYGNESAVGTIRIFHKPTLTFHLPGSVNHPLILIGPGTGVAPFISFLEHRGNLENDRKKSGGEGISSGTWRGGFDLDELDLPCEGNQVNKFIHSVKPGSIHLFYGCRNHDDYLFREKLEKFVADGTLTSLDVAMSRVDTKKCYVQDKIKEKGEELANLILNDGAYIYICGDGNQMAKDVQAMLKLILIEKGGLSEEDAQAYTTELRTRRRLLLDIWS